MATRGQQECSVHGKMRSYINLIPDGTQGGMRCAPGMECKVTGVPNGGGLVCSVHGKTRSVDAMVDDGNGGMRCGQHALCKVGTACSIHGKLRNPENMVDDGAGGLRCGPNAICKTGPQGDDDGKNRKRANIKRALCKYFDQGSCQKGELCCFAHGESELGQVIPEEALAQGPGQTNAATRWAASLGGTVNAPLGMGHFGALAALMEGGADALAIMSAMGGMGGLEAMGLAGMGMGAGGNPMEMYEMYECPVADNSAMLAMHSGSGKIAGRNSTAQGVCMLHNKMRTMSCLLEQPDGTIICKATQECRIVAKLASFGNTGNTGNSGNTGSYGNYGKSGNTIESLHKGRWNTKRNLCSFWQQGYCGKMDRCTYAHGEEELGMQIPMDRWAPY